MSVQKTFAIIKPDSVQAGHAGDIIAMIEKDGFKVVAMKLMHLTKPQAEGFYYVHKGKGFFDELVDFMTEGPIVALILEKEEAIKAWRDLMGSTNPADAADGTIRKKFGTHIGRNAAHGSDAEDTAAYETSYFFNAMERV